MWGCTLPLSRVIKLAFSQDKRYSLSYITLCLFSTPPHNSLLSHILTLKGLASPTSPLPSPPSLPLPLPSPSPSGPEHYQTGSTLAPKGTQLCRTHVHTHTGRGCAKPIDIALTHTSTSPHSYAHRYACTCTCMLLCMNVITCTLYMYMYIHVCGIH